jgi:hypothetical protein
MKIFNSARREFLSWISSSNKNDLNETEKKLLNLLITNFDILAPLGTAGGQRAKKLGRLIEKHGSEQNIVLPEPSQNTMEEKEQIQSIFQLKIGPFRGFKTEEIFTFDKKYTFMYGPNGSGKSSFCEGLEYALLGEIEEAETKRIDLEAYIKNIQSGKSQKPQIIGKKADGTTINIDNISSGYRFSFIEKNRIDAFGRISATTPKEQMNRISSLFGLDNFNEFVNGFTDDFDNRYITLTNAKEEVFNIEQDGFRRMQTRIEEIKNELINNLEKSSAIIEEINEKGVRDWDTLRIFLVGEGDVSGIIAELISKKSENIPEDFDKDCVKRIKESFDLLMNDINLLEEYKNELLKSASKINFKDLFEAIKAIGLDSTVNSNKCPACHTSLTKTVLNPFENAKSELLKMELIYNLQNKIESLCINLSKGIRVINKDISLLNKKRDELGETGSPFTCFTEIIFTSFDLIDSWKKQLSTEIIQFQNYSSRLNDVVKLVKEYNRDLEQRRIEKLNIDSQLTKYNRIKLIFDDFESNERHLKKEKVDLELKVTEFISKNDIKIQEIYKVREIIEQNTGFKKAYDSLIIKLKLYRDSLPAQLAEGLADKARDFYNIINDHDPDFEKLDFLSLPITSGKKIDIRFKGDAQTYDALHVLSEGHIKALGLSLLLAKVVKDDLGFIIFDDVVNAIDDDHRSGIATLLLESPDIENRQQIITCHGELFINQLTHKLGASRASKFVRDYKFSPTDSIESRGVSVFIADSRHYICRAQRKFEDNELKDCLTYCRKATESISENLWKKLSKVLNLNLQVTMRTPNGKPDLSTVVDGLNKVMNGIQLTIDSQLKERMKELKDNYNWFLLNKGTHEDHDLPEFQRDDVLKLLSLLESIEKDVMSLKLMVQANVKY